MFPMNRKDRISFILLLTPVAITMSGQKVYNMYFLSIYSSKDIVFGLFFFF